MARPLNRAQALENTAFLRALRRTANVRQAAKDTGVAYSTMQHRRTRHPAFAQRWDAALVVARARLGTAVGAVTGASRVTSKPAAGEPGRPTAVSPPASRGACGRGLRTLGGEEVFVRRADGTVQVRRAQPGKLTRACEQAFLLALSATANVSLSAAAVGVSFRAFDRRRKRDPAFAREWKAALARGYEQVEMALLASWMPGSQEHDAWQHNEPPPVPAMTANQALQLLYLHDKRARFNAERPDMRQRRGETGDAHSARLAAKYIQQLAEEAEHRLLTDVLRNERSAGIRHREPPIPPLPALDQVTGWSRADQNAMHAEAGRALFGGFRVEHLTAAQKALGRERLRKARGRKG